MAFNMFSPLRGLRAVASAGKAANAGAGKIGGAVKAPGMNFKMPKAPGLNKGLSAASAGIKAPKLAMPKMGISMPKVKL